MFNKEGGLIGAGMARVPMGCFEKTMKAFAEEYRGKDLPRRNSFL